MNNVRIACNQVVTSDPPVKKGLSGSALKWLAIVTMLIDHVGAFLLAPYLAQGGASLPYDLFQVNIILRLIGRIAFPLFTFLLVEGFFHTSNLKKYSLQMGVFALVSEIPFDLAQSGQVFDFSQQNVFWTLFIGLLTITFFDRLDGKTKIRWLVPLAGMLISQVLQTDYAALGILIIFIFYYYHNHFKLRNILM